MLIEAIGIIAASELIPHGAWTNKRYTRSTPTKNKKPSLTKAEIRANWAEVARINKESRVLVASIKYEDSFSSPSTRFAVN